jgi:hypothetical protein
VQWFSWQDYLDFRKIAIRKAGHPAMDIFIPKDNPIFAAALV